jgi:SHS family lactate transporter-like MFS transporter
MPGQNRQYNVVIASFLGWTLDAFDFFILLFVMGDIAKEFHSTVTVVSWAITLTLALRVVGALLFGRLADRFGRKPVLIANVLTFSVLECASGFAPTLTAFLVLRALFGIAMGGEWGVASSLTMESIPAHWRGFVSGLLQSGYSCGYLLAALLFGVGFDALGWRGLFIVAILPALLVLYIRSNVSESPGWTPPRPDAPGGRRPLAGRPKSGFGTGRYLYAIALMAAAATFSHGTQDLYPTFLRVQHGFSVHEVSSIAIVYNVGAILGCLSGGVMSQKIGRRRGMVVAAVLAVVLMPFWAVSSGPAALAVTAFFMQFFVQCMFGTMPAHLNEISPPEARATFPGFTYQFGNFLAAGNATLQVVLAGKLHGNYGFGMAVVAGAGAIAFALLAALGPEAREIRMTPQDGRGEPPAPENGAGSTARA